MESLPCLPVIARLVRRLALATLLLFTPGLASRAAEVPAVGTGTIEGRVLNARSGEYVENARIALEGSLLETFTDSDGYFRLGPVPAGTVRVRAFFTGLAPKVSELRVDPGATVKHDLELTAAVAAPSDDTVKLAEFVVGASREMEASAIAINEQRFAANIKSVVSTDEFGHVAEGNVGEFLKYLPGVTVEYGGGYARGISLDGVPSTNVPITIGGFDLASTGGPNNTNRSVQVDMASINNIARLEVSFSPTPEAQGAALAGSVNMIPRSSFERARPVFNLTVAAVMRDNARHTGRTPGPREEETRKVHPSVDFSYLVPVNPRFGFTLTGGTARQYTAEDGTTLTWRGSSAATNGNAFPHTTPDRPYLSSYVVRDAPKDTIRRSFGFTTDYRLTPRDRISFSFQYFTFNADTTNRALTFNVNRVLPGNFGPEFTRGAVGAGDLQLSHGGRDRINRTAMPSLVWRHDGALWKAEAGAGHSQGTNRIRDIDRGFFNTSVARRTEVTVAFEGNTYLRPSRFTVTDAAGAPVDPYRLDTYALVSSNSQQNDTTDVKRSAFANVRRDFYGRIPLGLKAGLDVREATRDLRGGTRPFTFVGADGRASTNPSSGDDAAAPYLDPHFSQRVPPFGHPRAQWASNEQLWRLYESRPATYTINANTWYRNEVAQSKYIAELVSAGYLRGDATLLQRRLKLVGGVRAEQTNIQAQGPLTDPTRNFQRDASGRVMLGANGRPVPIVPASDALGVSRLTYLDRGARAEKEYLRWFPSLNASYQIRENLLARAAYYQSVGRPDFNQYAGGITLPDTENPPANNNRIVVNNVGIKAWQAETFKARLEYYFEGVGLFSVGAFRRQFENFFGNTVFAATPEFLALYDLEPAQYLGYDVSTQYNLPGRVRMEGYSVEYKQALTFLPAWARGAQVFANFSSQRALGDETGDFAGYVPRSASWGASLTRPRYNLRLNWNYRARQRSAAVAPSVSVGAGAYNWQQSRLYLDVSGEYQLRPRLAFFANLRNATGTLDETEIAGPDTPALARLRQRTDIGGLLTLGFKGSF